MTNKQLVGCYLFTVSNSGLIFNHGWIISPRNVHPKLKKCILSSGC